eukprot:TRINITY_DN4162_c0_g1_i1.p1 TRINITY_DN4162_c0_g1~~TRINITY_DN4162_c0_g1_i1.p1  ORF type:complete len:2218 (+),score=557.03 TRINITY_DN4162_c0_g1_i1:71-6655(+)
MPPLRGCDQRRTVELTTVGLVGEFNVPAGPGASTPAPAGTAWVVRGGVLQKIEAQDGSPPPPPASRAHVSPPPPRTGVRGGSVKRVRSAGTQRVPVLRRGAASTTPPVAPLDAEAATHAVLSIGSKTRGLLRINSGDVKEVLGMARAGRPAHQHPHSARQRVASPEMRGGEVSQRSAHRPATAATYRPWRRQEALAAPPPLLPAAATATYAPTAGIVQQPAPPPPPQGGRRGFVANHGHPPRHVRSAGAGRCAPLSHPGAGGETPPAARPSTSPQGSVPSPMAPTPPPVERGEWGRVESRFREQCAQQAFAQVASAAPEHLWGCDAEDEPAAVELFEDPADAAEAPAHKEGQPCAPERRRSSTADILGLLSDLTRSAEERIAKRAADDAALITPGSLSAVHSTPPSAASRPVLPPAGAPNEAAGATAVPATPGSLAPAVVTPPEHLTPLAPPTPSHPTPPTQAQPASPPPRVGSGRLPQAARPTTAAVRRVRPAEDVAPVEAQGGAAPVDRHVKPDGVLEGDEERGPGGADGGDDAAASDREGEAFLDLDVAAVGEAAAHVLSALPAEPPKARVAHAEGLSSWDARTGTPGEVPLASPASLQWQMGLRRLSKSAPEPRATPIAVPLAGWSGEGHAPPSVDESLAPTSASSRPMLPPRAAAEGGRGAAAGQALRRVPSGLGGRRGSKDSAGSKGSRGSAEKRRASKEKERERSRQDITELPLGLDRNQHGLSPFPDGPDARQNTDDTETLLHAVQSLILPAATATVGTTDTASSDGDAGTSPRLVSILSGVHGTSDNGQPTPLVQCAPACIGGTGADEAVGDAHTPIPIAAPPALPIPIAAPPALPEASLEDGTSESAASCADALQRPPSAQDILKTVDCAGGFEPETAMPPSPEKPAVLAPQEEREQRDKVFRRLSSGGTGGGRRASGPAVKVMPAPEADDALASSFKGDWHCFDGAETCSTASPEAVGSPKSISRAGSRARVSIADDEGVVTPSSRAAAAEVQRIMLTAPDDVASPTLPKAPSLSRTPTIVDPPRSPNETRSPRLKSRVLSISTFGAALRRGLGGTQPPPASGGGGGGGSGAGSTARSRRKSVGGFSPERRQSSNSPRPRRGSVAKQLSATDAGLDRRRSMSQLDGGTWGAATTQSAAVRRRSLAVSPTRRRSSHGLSDEQTPVFLKSKEWRKRAHTHGFSGTEVPVQPKRLWYGANQAGDLSSSITDMVRYDPHTDPVRHSDDWTRWVHQRKQHAFHAVLLCVGGYDDPGIPPVVPSQTDCVAIERVLRGGHYTVDVLSDAAGQDFLLPTRANFVRVLDLALKKAKLADPPELEAIGGDAETRNTRGQLKKTPQVLVFIAARGGEGELVFLPQSRGGRYAFTKEATAAGDRSHAGVIPLAALLTLRDCFDRRPYVMCDIYPCPGGIQSLPSSHGFGCMAGCVDANAELDAAYPPQTQGLLSYYVLKGLGGKFGHGSSVTFGTLVAYVTDRLSLLKVQCHTDASHLGSNARPVFDRDGTQVAKATLRKYLSALRWQYVRFAAGMEIPLVCSNTARRGRPTEENMALRFGMVRELCRLLYRSNHVPRRDGGAHIPYLRLATVTESKTVRLYFAQSLFSAAEGTTRWAEAVKSFIKDSPHYPEDLAATREAPVVDDLCVCRAGQFVEVTCSSLAALRALTAELAAGHELLGRKVGAAKMVATATFTGCMRDMHKIGKVVRVNALAHLKHPVVIHDIHVLAEEHAHVFATILQSIFRGWQARSWFAKLKHIVYEETACAKLLHQEQIAEMIALHGQYLASRQGVTSHFEKLGRANVRDWEREDRQEMWQRFVSQYGTMMASDFNPRRTAAYLALIRDNPAVERSLNVTRGVIHTLEYLGRVFLEAVHGQLSIMEACWAGSIYRYEALHKAEMWGRYNVASEEFAERLNMLRLGQAEARLGSGLRVDRHYRPVVPVGVMQEHPIAEIIHLEGQEVTAREKVVGEEIGHRVELTNHTQWFRTEITRLHRLKLEKDRDDDDPFANFNYEWHDPVREAYAAEVEEEMHAREMVESRMLAMAGPSGGGARRRLSQAQRRQSSTVQSMDYERLRQQYDEERNPSSAATARRRRSEAAERILASQPQTVSASRASLLMHRLSVIQTLAPDTAPTINDITSPSTISLASRGSVRIRPPSAPSSVGRQSVATPTHVPTARRSSHAPRVSFKNSEL